MTMTLSTPDDSGTPISSRPAPAPGTPDAVSGAAGPGSSALGRTADLVSVGGVVFTGAIFGFFYAWVCSTMWGLDNADPRVAIEAMQAMNASVRNAVFFPAFFLTPIVLALAAALLRRTGRYRPARWFVGAAVVYLVGGLLLTMAINVPMNEDLADVIVPADRAAAEAIWTDYSGDWQIWNTIRTVLSGIALAMAAIGLRARNR